MNENKQVELATMRQLPADRLSEKSRIPITRLFFRVRSNFVWVYLSGASGVSPTVDSAFTLLLAARAYVCLFTIHD